MGWKPSLWASVIPRDPTERKPNQYAEMLRVLWENRDQLPLPGGSYSTASATDVHWGPQASKTGPKMGSTYAWCAWN